MEHRISHQAFDFMQNMVDYSSNASAIWSTNKYCFIYGNKKLADLLGYNQEDLVGMKFVDALHPKDVDRSIAEYERNTSNGLSMINDFPNRYIKKNGDVIWVIWKAAHNDVKLGLGFGEVVEPKWWQKIWFNIKYR